MRPKRLIQMVEKAGYTRVRSRKHSRYMKGNSVITIPQGNVKDGTVFSILRELRKSGKKEAS